MNILETLGSSAISPQREIIKIKASIHTETANLLVAGYARVSSDSADQLNSFSAQVRYYTGLIENHDGWDFVEVYADEGTTGVSTEKRDDFNRMIADCRKGKINRIITKSTSRFARNTLDAISTIRELKEIGVTVLFEKENLDTAKLSSENLLTLYSLFAQEESMSISKNVKRGTRMRMQKGTYVSSNPPYGYRLVNRQLEIHEQEAETVRRIFSEYLNGVGCGEIAKRLTAEGVLTKCGAPKWSYQTITIIIRNERYIGDMLLQKKFNEDAMPYRQTINRGQLPKVYVKNTHEPIVSRIEFELANILLKERSANIAVGKRNEYLLSRKIRCKECGNVYRRKIPQDTPYWVCRRHDSDKELCLSERITEDALYSAFAMLYNKLKQNYSNILIPMRNSLEKLQEIQTRGNLEISTINKQIAELSEQNHVMTGLSSSGTLDPALFISEIDEINRKIRILKVAKARLLAEQESDGVLEKTQDLIEIIENGPDRISVMEETLFADMVEKITAHDTKTVDFTLVNGLVLTERL